jgi:hypothetical protein
VRVVITERQYEQMLRNGAARSAPRRLGDGPELASLVRHAARGVQRLDDAAAAWERVADPAWAGRTAVVSRTGDCLVISAADATLRYHLTRHAAQLRAALAALLPGVRTLRFVPGRA